jgi:hypothetical protein
MKKILGVTALGVALALGAATASFAQATGGAGGAGGPGNGDTAGSPTSPMKNSSGGMSGMQQKGSGTMTNGGAMGGNNGSPANQYPAPGGTTK